MLKCQRIANALHIVKGSGSRWTVRHSRNMRAVAVAPVPSIAEDLLSTLSGALEGPGASLLAWSLFEGQQDKFFLG